MNENKTNMLNIFIKTYNKHKEAILYLFFGGTTFFLNMLLYTTFVYITNINELIANIISWIIVVAFAFVTNKYIVFDNKSSDTKHTTTQLSMFYTSRLTTLIIEEFIIFIFITKLQYNNIIVKLIAQIIVIVINYLLSKLIIFKK